MRDHELELIAALVEGRLDDESEARALIASSPEAREEYEAQRLGYEALQEAGSVSLSEQESAALRRDVWTELRAGANPKRARTPWYYRWVPVTAGLFVVIGLAAVFGQVGGGDEASDETMRLADAPLEATTSTAAATGEVDEDAGGGDAAPGDGAQTATTTKAEEAGDTVAGEESEGSAALYADVAELVRQGDFTGGELEAYDSNEARSVQVAECLETLGLADYQVVATLPVPAGNAAVEDATTTTDPSGPVDPLLIAVPDPAETASTPVAFVDIEGCELVYLDQ